MLLLKQKSRVMRKAFLIIILSLFFFGCNINPSKEARIQKLETEAQQTIDKIKNLERSLQKLEGENKQLKARVLELEKTSSN